MYNTDLPSRADLPTSRQLVRSTLIALAAAAAILLTIVLPAEYAIDPTGVGRFLGLAEMGDIKSQLAKEAEQDRLRDSTGSPPASGKQSGSGAQFFAGLFVKQAAAQTAVKLDETVLTLKPGEGVEIKLVMKRGAKADFSWNVTGGNVNFDLHGDGGGRNISYEKGRGVSSAKGVLEASFDGNHGWFWRNRGAANVTVTLRTSGDYSEIKRVM